MGPRQLPPHLIASFKKAFVADLGYEITDEQADEYGQGALRLVVLLAKNHPGSFESPSVSNADEMPSP